MREMRAARVGDLVKCWQRPIQGLVIDEYRGCLLVLWNERRDNTIDPDGTEWLGPEDVDVISENR